MRRRKYLPMASTSSCSAAHICSLSAKWCIIQDWCVLQAHGVLASSAAAHSYTPCIVAVRLVMMAPHEDQGFESMLAQLDARGCRVTRAERQSSASHPRQPLVNAEEVGASSVGENDLPT